MEQELRDFGLTDKEAKVYLAALKLGKALVQEIAKKAGTYRTYTYEILNSLKDKGLVSSYIQSGKQYFEIAQPQRLLSILQEKETAIKNILPQLNSMYQSAAPKTNVLVYEGKEGIKTILEDMIKTKQEILMYGSTGKQLETLQFNFPNFIKRRIQHNIRTKVITEKSPETIQMQRSDKRELRKIHFLPKSMHFPTVTNIYGNKVAIFSLEKECMGIIIENKDIVKTQTILFNLLLNITRKT